MVSTRAVAVASRPSKDAIVASFSASSAVSFSSSSLLVPCCSGVGSTFCCCFTNVSIRCCKSLNSCSFASSVFFVSTRSAWIDLPFFTAFWTFSDCAFFSLVISSKSFAIFSFCTSICPRSLSKVLILPISVAFSSRSESSSDLCASKDFSRSPICFLYWSICAIKSYRSFETVLASSSNCAIFSFASPNVVLASFNSSFNRSSSFKLLALFSS